jgi:hypothetical protein
MAGKKNTPDKSALLAEMFEGDDVEISMIDAFCFSQDAAFLQIEAVNEDEDTQVSALLKVSLQTPVPTYSVMHAFNMGTSAYYARSPERHYILASGGYLHEVVDGVMTFHQPASENYLQKLAAMDGETIAVFGDEGEVFAFQGGTYRRIVTGTEETIRAMHIKSAGLGVAVGDAGTFLQWNGTALTEVALGVDDRMYAVHIAADGSVLLGCSDGVAMVRSGDKLVRMQAGSADLTSVTEFQGAQYWGDDDHGIYVRKGDKLLPAFNTEYAFTMNATENCLIVNAGSTVYRFDGTTWLGLKLNPSIDGLVERVEVSF